MSPLKPPVYMFDKNKIDLDAPAFGEGAQKADTTESSSVVSQTEKKVEEKEEQSVPYSRFNTVRERAINAEAEVREANARYEEMVKARDQFAPRSTQEVSPDQEWIEMFGNSEASKRAFQLDLKRREAAEEKAEQRALEAVQNMYQREEEQKEENLGEIDERLEELQDFVGRKLTEVEEDKLLGIVDEYTPKDSRGNYAGDLLPFDKAWEILEMKEAKSTSATRRSRDAVASISSSRSEGDTSIAGKNVRPLSWSSYQDRLRN